MRFRIVGQEDVWSNENDKWEIIGKSKDIIKEIVDSVYVIDTETTGLKWMHNDKIFSIALTTLYGPVYYFNFQDNTHHKQMDLFESNIWNDGWLIKDKNLIAPLFERHVTWIGHNIKFDWHMLRKFGFRLEGDLVDTMGRERLVSNDEWGLGPYSLASCIKRNLPEYAKDDQVEKYISERGLFSMEAIPGKKGFFKNKQYSLVPFSLIAPYAANDVHITRELFKEQNKKLYRPEVRDQTRVMSLETRTLKLCCEIEEHGILIDKNYCEQAIEAEDKKVKAFQEDFKKEYGREFIDSAKELAPAFRKIGYNPPQTQDKNDSISASFLETVDHKLARDLQTYRDALKRSGTYFQNFLNLSDKDGILHPDMKPSGTRTGRFSYSDPNLQNVPSNDASEFPVRRAIIPRPGHFFVMIDYAQQEFRMMLDYAEEMELIDKIKNGHDPHQATADLTGLTRKAAKALNFGLMYGMGIQRLANEIGVTYDEAKAFKQKYFAALPRVRQLIYNVTNVAEKRACVYTWMYRKLDFKIKEIKGEKKSFAYKAINAVIQGGCADVTKLAMVTIDNALKAYGTRIVLQIHDELVFEVPYDEVHIIGMLQNTMESIYPHKHIPLTTSVSFSLESLHDTKEASSPEEIEAAIREFVSRDRDQTFEETPQYVLC